MPRHALTSDEGLKDAARSTLRELLSVSKRYRARRRRLDKLFLFMQRTRRGKTSSKSTIAYGDSPEMELMLEHRDGYDRLGETIEEARIAVSKAAKNIEPDDPYTLSKMLSTILSLERERARHLTEIKDILGQVSRELMAQENVLAKVVAEGAKLAQLAQLNRERIEAQLEVSGVGLESKTNDELTKLAMEMKQRIAAGELVVDAEHAEEDEG